jgi:hypothetical protein
MLECWIFVVGCFAFKIPPEKFFPIYFSLGQPLSNPTCQNVAQERLNMTTINATDKQLELGFSGLPPRAAAGREGRIARANWWFARMRAIVENAMDWSAAAEPRPEQIWMPGARREVKV